METLNLGYYIIDDPCPYWIRSDCNIIEVIGIQDGYVIYRYENEYLITNRKRHLDLFLSSDIQLIPLTKLTRELLG